MPDFDYFTTVQIAPDGSIRLAPFDKDSAPLPLGGSNKTVVISVTVGSEDPTLQFATRTHSCYFKNVQSPWEVTEENTPFVCDNILRLIRTTWAEHQARLVDLVGVKGIENAPS